MWAALPSILLTSVIMSLVITKNPITLGAAIFLLAATAAIIITTISSSWFRLALFIIFIGGLMVIFAYFVSLIPNQRLSLTTPVITALSLTALFFMLTSPARPNFAAQCSPQDRITPSLVLYHPQTTLFILLLGLVLLLALIAVVKITKITRGPLRHFSYTF